MVRNTVRFIQRLVLLLLVSGALVSCEDTNIAVMTDAASDAVTAMTLTDDEVRSLASQASQVYDRKYEVAAAGNRYAMRLQKLVRAYTQRDGYRFDFKVYLTEDVNAFAMADGTIRVYSGLMDRMNDEELLFIIGHEMGHVVLEHSRRKVVLAYASSALRKGLAAQENEVGQLARSVLGGFAQQLTNAQFSQHEERQADQYGVRFLVTEGYSRNGAVSALTKLADLASQHTFLSSHPEPESRAEAIAAGDGNNQPEEHSLLSSLLSMLKGLVLWLLGLLTTLLHWLLSLLGN